MTEQPSEGSGGVNLYGFGDIDMRVGPTRAVGHAVAGVGHDLGRAIPDLLAKIKASHEAISANITERDEVSRKYMEQENNGLSEFVDAMNGMPERVAGDAVSCFRSMEYYLENDGNMEQRMRTVSDPPVGPESRA